MFNKITKTSKQIVLFFESSFRQERIMIKAKTLEPNEYGNYPCPYCGFILTAILREWMNPPHVTDYVCHRCKIMFEIKFSFRGDILSW